MTIAGLYNVPQDEDQLNQFSFFNAAAHTDIIRVIFQETGLSLASYVLDPINPAALQSWLYQHQIMHQQMDALLGIAGYDLLDVDWRDPGQFAAWIEAHAIEHVQAAQILGVD